MQLRLMSVIGILLLAGCASSEPQNVSYAPLAAAVPAAPAAGVVAPPPIDAARMPVASAAPLSAASPASLNAPAPVDASAPVVPKALQDQTGLMPPTGDGAVPAAVLPPGATNCSTVDGVTLCDAPADAITTDPITSSDDDAYNTN